MPKKSSNKMASRQAQLSKKRSRGKPNVYISPEKSASTQPQASKEDSAANEVAVDVALKERAQVPTVAPTPTKREKASASAMETYSYVWPEVKRIGIISGLIFVILAVLTVFLR